MPVPIDSHQDRIRAHLLESAEIKRKTVETCMESIMAAASLITEVFRSDGKLMLCWNGGSAADCQHMAAELTSCFSRDIERPGLPAIALTTDTSMLTAYSNDFGYEGVFARQVEALGRSGDVLIGLSTSGGSKNVIRAVEAAQSANMHTISLTGARGRLAEMTDISVSVLSTNTQHIQESHLAIEHVICEIVEQDLFGRPAQS